MSCVDESPSACCMPLNKRTAEASLTFCWLWYPRPWTMCCVYFADVRCGRHHQACCCVCPELCGAAGTLLLCLWIMGLSESSVRCHVSVCTDYRCALWIIVCVCVCTYLVYWSHDLCYVTLLKYVPFSFLQSLGPRSDSQFWAFLVFLHGNVWPLQNILHLRVSNQRLHTGLPPQFSFLVSYVLTYMNSFIYLTVAILYVGGLVPFYCPSSCESSLMCSVFSSLSRYTWSYS